MSMDEMPVRDVTRERGAVDDQNAVPLARQEHRGRSTGAARSDDDRVVHFAAPSLAPGEDGIHGQPWSGNHREGIRFRSCSQD
jgi:hypothetical protein